MLSDHRRAILEQLRDGPLDHFEIANNLDLAPFVTRAELKALKRDRLVRDEMGRRSILWRLTPKGELVAFHGQQLRLA